MWLLLVNVGVAGVVPLVGDVLVERDGAGTCARVKVDGLSSTLLALDSYVAGNWQCPVGQTWCSTVYTTADGEQSAIAPGACGAFAPVVAMAGATVYFDDVDKQLVIPVPTTTRSFVSVASSELDLQRTAGEEGWHLWGTDVDGHAYADLGLVDIAVPTQADFEELFGPGVDTRIRGCTHCGIIKQLGPESWNWQFPATVNALSSVQATHMFFELPGLNTGIATEYYDMLVDTASELATRPGNPSVGLYGMASPNVLGTYANYEAFISDVAAAGGVGWSVDDMHGELCDPLDGWVGPPCLTTGDVGLLAQYNPEDFWFYTPTRILPRAIVNSYILGADTASFTSTDRVELVVDLTMAAPLANEAVLVSFLFYDDVQVDHTATACDEELALGVYHDGSLLLEDLHREGHDEVARGLPAPAWGENVQLARVAIPAPWLQLDGPLVDDEVRIRLSHPGQPPAAYGCGAPNWKDYGNSSVGDTTNLYVWDIQVDILDAAGNRTPVDTTGFAVQQPPPGTGFRNTTSDAAGLRFAEDVDGLLVNFPRNVMLNLERAHATSSTTPFPTPMAAWNTYNEELFTRLLASACDAVSGDCVYYPRAYENGILAGAAHIGIDGQKLEIADAVADGTIGYQYPLTMYPSDDTTGILGQRLDQGVFEENVSFSSANPTLVWKSSTQAPIRGWSQGFEWTVPATGTTLQYCFEQDASSDFEHRLLRNGSVLGTWSLTSTPSCHNFAIAPGDRIRAELNLLDSAGDAEAYVKITTFDIDGIDHKGSREFLPLAHPEATGFYQCVANHWIAGNTDACF